MPEKKTTAAVPPTPESPHIEDRSAPLTYTNFCRINATPEEVILDFGTNTEPTSATSPVRISASIVCNYFTAKRLFQHLGMAIERHESAFGLIETDVGKRLKSG